MATRTPFLRAASVIGSTVLVLTIAFAPAFPQNTTPAHAFGVGANASFEINPALVTHAITDTSVTTVLNGLAWTVAKTAIRSLTRSTVNWINSGFNGSPAFVTDLNANLQQLSDAVADDFFDSLQNNIGVDVRSPFQDQITQALRDNYYRSTAGFYGGGYDLNRYSDDPQGFINGDFKRGGFDAWFATLSNDENNPLGAYHSAENALTSRVENFRINRLHELTFGNGFLSWRGDCKVKKPAGAPTSLTKKDDCLQYEIKTPGSVIESALIEDVNSPLHELQLADSINEILGALAGQLVGQVLGGNGLAGISQPSSGGGSSYLDRATDPSQAAGNGSSLANGFTQTITTAQNETREYQSNWQKIQNAANTAGSCVDASVVSEAKSAATAALAKAASALTALNSINAKITSAQVGTNSATAIATASQDYQSLLSSGTLLGYQDISDAQTQASSVKTGDNDSLYMQLTKTCSSGR